MCAASELGWPDHPHHSNEARGRDRDSVLRVRRRAKLERDVAAFCTGGGVTVEVARCGLFFL